jgi:ABC-type transport system involved in multi-copper enzyme maturation permease subunit
VTAVRNVLAIAEKEWRHYFGSPIAYVALFVWTMLFGIFFYFSFAFFLEQSMRSMGGGGRQDVAQRLPIGPVIRNMAVVAPSSPPC